MWFKEGRCSDGHYAVTQELLQTLRLLSSIPGKQKDELKTVFTGAVLNIEKYSMLEADIVMSLVAGGDF